jgi:hypothetical protein
MEPCDLLKYKLQGQGWVGCAATYLMTARSPISQTKPIERYFEISDERLRMN